METTANGEVVIPYWDFSYWLLFTAIYLSTIPVAAKFHCMQKHPRTVLKEGEKIYRNTPKSNTCPM